MNLIHLLRVAWNKIQSLIKMKRVKLSLKPPTASDLKSVNMLPLTDNGNENLVAGMLDVHNQGGLCHAMYLDEEPVGIVSIMPNLELMIAVSPSYQKMGIGSRALKLFLDHAFGTGGFTKIWAKAQIGRPSTRLASNLGVVEVHRSSTEVSYEFTANSWFEGRKR